MSEFGMTTDAIHTTQDPQGTMNKGNEAITALKVNRKSKEELIERYNPKHECITPEVTKQVNDSGADKTLKRVVLEVAFDSCPTPTAPNAISKDDMKEILEYRR